MMFIPGRGRLLTAIYVAAFAELGVLTRLYLDKLFQDGCTGGWGLCLTSAGRTTHSLGAYYTDLPPNILGSFFMGCLATSAALGLSLTSAVAVLPASHPWQRNAALQTGLRTGYCGSLTTFSAWQLQEMLMLIGGRGRLGGQWYNALWGALIGMQTSLASLTMGEHVALAVHRWLQQEGRRPGVVDGAHPTSVPEEYRGRRALLLAAKVEAAGLSKSSATEAEAVKQETGPGNGHSAVDIPADADQRRSAEMQLGPNEAVARGAHISLVGKDRRAAGASGPRDPGRGPLKFGPPPPADSRRSAELELGSDEGGPSGEEEDLPEQGAEEATAQAKRRSGNRKTHAAVAALLVLLTALFVVLTIVDSGRQHATRRGIWLSVLFGPSGALLRWLLADFNYRLPGGASWFPAGTFAANFIACVIIYCAEVPNDVRVLGYWAKIVVYAIQKGFCGALSTVSTFVNEINRAFEVWPDRPDAYAYILITFGAAWVAGVVVYGAPAWAHM